MIIIALCIINKDGSDGAFGEYLKIAEADGAVTTVVYSIPVARAHDSRECRRVDMNERERHNRLDTAALCALCAHVISLI